MIKSCVYCGSPVIITNKEESSFKSHGINLFMVRVSCSSCSDQKIQPMQSEDG